MILQEFQDLKVITEVTDTLIDDIVSNMTDQNDGILTYYSSLDILKHIYLFCFNFS